jgi:1-acyl-sn-glycerol-3-phosphate acyltransferase
MAGKLMYGLLYLMFHGLIKLGWFRWRVEGLDRLPPRERGGVLLAMNHIHWLDIPMAGTLLPLAYRPSWLGKSELFAHPVAAWFFQQMQVVPIQRGKRDLAALHAATDLLRNGAVLLVFPEGHRSRSGVLQPGQRGIVRLAVQSGAPIVPLTIFGSQHGALGTLLRREVVLHVGEPYTIATETKRKLPPDTMQALTDDLMRQIAAPLPAAYRGPYADEPATASR